MPRTMIVDLESPDYTLAMNALDWALHNARRLGYGVPSNFDIALRLMKGELTVPFYSDMGKGMAFGVMTAPGPYIDEEFDEVLDLYMKRVRRRREHARACEVVAALAQGIEAATAGETPKSDSTEGESPVRDSECAQTPGRTTR